MFSQIKEEKEGKEKEGGKEEIVNGIYMRITLVVPCHSMLFNANAGIFR